MSKKVSKLAAPILMALLLGGLTNCAYVVDHRGPPMARPYAYDYYYYPSLGVYFSLYTGYYYYRTGTVWQRVRRLPPGYYLDYRDRRSLVIRDNHPYQHDQRYRQTYRPPANFRPTPERNREERQHNNRQHDEYMRKYGRQ